MCHYDLTFMDIWNGYGWEIRQRLIAGMTSEEAFVDIELLDSDGDGSSNIDEIDLDTQPGWQEGATNTVYLADGSVWTGLMPPTGILGDLDPPDGHGALFLRGDCDTSGSIDLTDAIFGLDALFAGGAPPSCVDACDVNDDGAFEIADVTYASSSMFTGGPAPAAPYPDCGEDPTPFDAVGCESSTTCP